MDHFLLQNWTVWWQNVVALWLNGGWQTLNGFCLECNAEKNPARDAGNLATGTGAGISATRDAFKNLWGVSTPKDQPRDGGDAVRNTVREFGRQAADGIFGGQAGSSSAPSSSSSPSSSASPAPTTTNLADVLPPELGGSQGTSQPNSSNPFADFLPPETPLGGKP